MQNYLPATVEYLTRFFSTRLDEYREDLREISPEKGWGNYHRQDEVRQVIINILGWVEDELGDIRIPEGYPTPLRLIEKLQVIRKALNENTRLVKEVVEYYQQKEHRNPPFPVDRVKKINDEVVDAFNHALSLDEVQHLLGDEGNMRNIEATQLEIPKQFDVAFSFAGENRDYVKQVRDELCSYNISVFYDEDYKVSLWGNHLGEILYDIYANRARYVVIFISAAYAAKDWTNHEKRAALDRAIKERRDYILPARFDDTELEGLSTSIVYIPIGSFSSKEFAEMIASKIGAQRQESTVSDETIRPVITEQRSTNDVVSSFSENRKHKKDLDKYLTDQGIEDVSSEITSLFDQLEQNLKEVKMQNPDLYLDCGSNQCNFIMRVSGRGAVSVGIHWAQQYLNTLDNAELNIVSHRGAVTIPGRNEMMIHRPYEISRETFVPVYEENEKWRWNDLGRQKRFTVEKLKVYILGLFFRLIEQYENSDVI